MYLYVLLFDSRLVHFGYVVGEVALKQGFTTEYRGFALQV